MAVIQISKIQLRRGAEIELPGKPTSLSPLAFAPGLEPGELGFAEDSGRLFVGHAPTIGNPNHQRVDFPYQNIEVLTENSPVLGDLFDARTRALGRAAHFETLLPTNTSDETDWTTVMVPGGQGALVPLRFEVARSVLAEVDYSVFAIDQSPVRIGRLTIVHNGGPLEPQVTDHYAAYRAVDGSGATVGDSTAMFSDLRFRARETSDDLTHVTLQIRNRTGSPLRLFTRFARVRP